MTTTTRIEDLRRQAAAIEREEYLVETNEGTFGSAECFRKCGTGDPAFGNYRIYETVAGDRRIVGNPDGAPGRARNLNRDDLAEAKQRLRRVLAEIRRAAN